MHNINNSLVRQEQETTWLEQILRSSFCSIRTTGPASFDGIAQPNRARLTQPSLACATVAEKSARYPLRHLGAGGVQLDRRRLNSSSETWSVMSPLRKSKEISSPVSTRAMGPPTAASGEQ